MADNVNTYWRDESITPAKLADIKAMREPVPDSIFIEAERQVASSAMLKSKAMIVVREAIFLPPFLRPNDIHQRRFAEHIIKRDGRRIAVKIPELTLRMNDRWWEWEEELQKPPADLRKAGIEPRLPSENTAPAKVISSHARVDVTVRGRRRVSTSSIVRREQLRCVRCSHHWWPHERSKSGGDPKRCPRCGSARWKGIESTRSQR